MQSINGVEFHAERPSSGAHSKKSQQNTPPGTDINPITRLGINGFQMQLNVVEEHLDRYDALVAEFMKQQELILILRDGWEYHVEALGVQFPDMVIEKGEKYRFSVPLISETPYQYSVDEVTVSKTITANNTEWDAGDGGTSIETAGTVAAVPDVSVTGGALGSNFNRPSGATDQDTLASTSSTSTGYQLKHTSTFTADPNLAWEGIYAQITAYNVNSLRSAWGKVTVQATSYNGGVETTLIELFVNGDTPTQETSSFSAIAGGNETMTFRLYVKTSNPSYAATCTNYQVDVVGLRKNACNSPRIYNLGNTSIQTRVANELEPDMVATVNADGTGAVSYADDFSTTKYIAANWDLSGVTHDAGDEELDVADGGYIEYIIDTKYPIAGIPVLTSQINITAGAPTVQISSDGETYYDIDFAVVDDVETAYSLNSIGNLELDGETVIYFRFDCTGGAVNTCSIKSFSFACVTVPTDVENTVIGIGGTNTFRCTQDADSSMNCTVDIIFNHRKWMA